MHLYPLQFVEEGALFVINVTVSNEDEKALLTALRDPSAELPYVHQNEELALDYLHALKDIKKNRLQPPNTFVSVQFV